MAPKKTLDLHVCIWTADSLSNPGRLERVHLDLMNVLRDLQAKSHVTESGHRLALGVRDSAACDVDGSRP